MALDHITIRRPADMHCHFRQGEVLKLVTPATARVFDHVIAMPNTTPPITTAKQCREYVAEILSAAGGSVINPHFRPLGVAYINEDLTSEEIRKGFEEGVWVAGKLYPKGGTTGSELAAESIRSIYPQLEVMQELGMLLLIHGEVVGPEGREHARWDRETIHAREVMPQLRRDFPRLKMVREHISTKLAVQEVLADDSGFVAATITPHHALLTDADVSRGGLYVDANCLPIIKGPEDREALQAAMTSGDQRFFAGTDSAPHDTTKKYSRCCSFGAYVAPGALEAYAAVFEQRGVFEKADGVERFEKFMSLNGPNFYGLNPSRGMITLLRNTHEQVIRERFTIVGKKILEPNTEIIALFHEDVGLVRPFPWVQGSVNPG